MAQSGILNTSSNITIDRVSIEFRLNRHSTVILPISDGTFDNVLDSDRVSLTARVRRNERNPAPITGGLPVDRVRQIAAEGRMSVEISDAVMVTGALEADWTRRRLRAIAIDPRQHSNLAATASLGFADVSGRWSAMASWHRNEATGGRNDMVRAAALLGGAMRSGDGWSLNLVANADRASRLAPILSMTMGSWSMAGREAEMLGSTGSHRDNRVMVSLSQRF